MTKLPQFKYWCLIEQLDKHHMIVDDDFLPQGLFVGQPWMDESLEHLLLYILLFFFFAHNESNYFVSGLNKIMRIKTNDL